MQSTGYSLVTAIYAVGNQSSRLYRMTLFAALSVAGAALQPAIALAATEDVELISLVSPLPPAAANGGTAVSISNGTAVVGAPSQNSAYVYTYDGVTNSWTYQTTLTGGASTDQFGASISISADNVAIGAPGASSNAGAVYIFNGSGASWTQSAMLTEPGAAAGDKFGYAVGMDGLRLVIGAPNKNFNAKTEVGTAYLYSSDGTNWNLNTNISRITLAKLKEFERLGIRVQTTAFGNKGMGLLTRIGSNLVSQEVQLGDKPDLDRLLGAIKVQLDAYLDGRIDALYVATTRFINTMKQEPVFLRLLPLSTGLDDPFQTGVEAMAKTAELKTEYNWDFIYEPDAKTVIDDLLHRYVEGLLYQAVAENMASEQSARMVAMKAASDNAKKVIGDLQLVYNKTRQAAITKEISEIVGGAAAV